MTFHFKSTPADGYRLAIEYSKEYEANRAYEQILKNEKKHEFIAEIELFKSSLNLSLKSLDSGKSHLYKHVNYSPQHIHKLLQMIETKTEFKFFHVYSKSNVLTVCKPFGRSTFISILSVSLINPINL